MDLTPRPVGRPALRLRCATAADVSALAEMNRELIHDEGHRNPMALAQLEDRMRGWLATDYEAVIVESNAETVAYALFRDEPEWIYLRQFFVRAAHRRNGIGREMFGSLVADWKRCKPMLRLDVLVNNHVGIAFWRSVGLEDYCLTMECSLD